MELRGKGDKAVHYFKHVIPLPFSAGGLFKAEIISHCKKKKKEKMAPGLIITIRRVLSQSRSGERPGGESQVAKKVTREEAAEGEKVTQPRLLI